MIIPAVLKKGLFPVLVSGVVFCVSCSHKLAPDGHYQETPVVADGNTNDWSLPLRFSNESYTLQYNVTNDNKNLYICILSRDYATQMRMLRAGMSIFFDPKGEKDRKIGIVFPIKKQSDPDNTYHRRGNNPITAADTKSHMESLLLQSDAYNTIGLLNLENGQFNVNDSTKPIRIAMKLNNNDSVLVYEAVIPIRNILGADLNPRSDLKNFSVGIILNSVPAQGGNGSRPSYGGGGGGMRGMGGMRGGMMGGGGGGRRSYGQSGGTAIKEEADWYQFRLVARKSS